MRLLTGKAALLPFMLLACLFAGCYGPAPDADRETAETPADGERAGYISGVAILADAEEGEHAGIDVYLSGTSYSAKTDENGSYTISRVPRGTFSVIAEKEGYQKAKIAEAEVYPDIHTAENPLVLPTEILESTDQSKARRNGRFGSLIGQVLLENATSNEDVRVRLEGTQLVTVSDEIGVYRFLNVEPGTYDLTFTKRGYGPFTVAATVISGEEVQVQDVALESVRGERELVATPAPTPAEAIQRRRLTGSRVITGQLVLAELDGTPITDYSRATVSLDNSDYIMSPDETGRFRFENLSPGIYTVLANLDGGSPQSQTVDLTANPTANITFRLGGAAEDAQATGTGTITGRVILPGDDDEPLPDAGGVRVSLLGTQFSVTSQQDGTFTLSDVTAGEYVIEATREEFVPARVQGVIVEGGATVDVGDLILEPIRDYPRVLSTIPPNGTENVQAGRELVVQVKFSKKMNPANVRGAIRVDPPANWRAFIGRGSHPLADDDNLVITFSNLDEDLPIRFKSPYTITITREATDMEGLAMREDYVLRFRTGAPGVIYTYPADGERGAYLDQISSLVTISFNTKLRTRDLDERDFRITPSPASYPQVIHLVDPQTGWSTVRIQARFAPEQNYAVTVKTSVRALTGQALGNTPYTFRFSTGALVQLDEQIGITR